MSQVRDQFKEHPSLRILIMILGLFISAVGVNGFLRQAHLLSGGVTGFATAINYLTGLNVGFVTFLINIPIFILGFIYLKKDFCLFSMFNMIIYSLILGLTQDLGKIIPVHDILLQTVFGGFLNGLGIGLIFRAKASAGGTDIISAILKMKRNIEVKNTSLAFNIVVVLVGCLFFNITLGLYTLIGFYISSMALGFIKDAMNYQRSLIIISDHPEVIADDIIKEMIRGVTYIHATGAYTGQEKKIIYTTISYDEIPEIKEIVFRHDPNAFITINEINEVRGRGFKSKDI
ncbi:YitT family protein [Peptostreptococcus anaerobius]|uniref:YitT family protein n=1 Tax=Peptostreptococcus porci TaxID=2652282 RepID=A0A6N7WYW6_9FIRM|nr:YitT family protein [Peptostreptococcus porci]MST62065.1 YitT family protein [Peptostreptococcus porci]